jgi:hypothetical protein
VSGDVELVHGVGPDRGAFDVVYAEDNPLWVLAGLLVAVALALIIAVLGAFYLAGLWLAGRVERWAKGQGR